MHCDNDSRLSSIENTLKKHGNTWCLRPMKASSVALNVAEISLIISIHPCIAKNWETCNYNQTTLPVSLRSKWVGCLDRRNQFVHKHPWLDILWHPLFVLFWNNYDSLSFIAEQIQLVEQVLHSVFLNEQSIPTRNMWIN